MPFKAKIISLSTMWIFGLLSILFWIPNNLFLVKIVVLLLLLIGTLFILRVKNSE
jgi:hypothetical protein